jgi:hypothetical protein
MRGGSSITFETIYRLYNSAGGKFNDIVGRLYATGYLLNECPVELQTFEPTDYIYGPFRDNPSWIENAISESQPHLIVILRDPRDCLVSHYHITRKTHSLFTPAIKSRPAHEFQRATHYADINVHVLVWARYYRMVLQNMRRLVERFPRSIVYRYEDIRKCYPAWVDDVISVLGLPSNDAVQAERGKLASTVVLEKPFISNADAHHRSGASNTYADELCGEVVDELNFLFDEPLSFFGYRNQGLRQDFLAHRSIGSNSPSPTATELDPFRQHLSELDQENGYRIQESLDLRARISALEAHLVQSSS